MILAIRNSQTSNFQGYELSQVVTDSDLTSLNDLILTFLLILSQTFLGVGSYRCCSFVCSFFLQEF